MLVFFHDPEATAEVITSLGWLYEQGVLANSERVLKNYRQSKIHVASDINRQKSFSRRRFEQLTSTSAEYC
jgi:hypothetical protein